FVGALQALRAANFKSVLANSTVASLGVLVMLIGLDGPTATVAMVGYVLAHALYKASLFFCAVTVLHATGLSILRSIGGLPPFIGFISKEFLFLAQIESSWDAIPVAVAVLVNAVIVGVAGVVTLRPFFLDHDKVKEVKHGEVPAMLVGPVVLALLGLVIS